MKTALVASVVLTSLAGAAGAGMLISTPTRSVGTVTVRPAPQMPVQQVSVPPVAAPAVAAVHAQVAPAPPAPAAKPDLVDTARPPVPLRITHRQPLPEKPGVSDSKANANGIATTDGSAGTDKPEAAPDEKSQQTARAAIEADGYKGVQMLSQGSNGVWKASALRGKTRIVVSVDQAGNVFTE